MQLTSKGIRKFVNDQRRVGVFFVLPSLTVLSIFVFLPLVVTVIFSFFSIDLMGGNFKFTGLDNYAKLIGDSRFWNSLGNTFYYTFVSVPLQIILALLVTLAIERKTVFNAMLKSVYFLPAICSMTIISIIWTFILDNDIGILNYYLRQIGINAVAWLKEPAWAMPTVILVGVWKTFGFNMVIFLAGLQGIPIVYYEAAQIDGAGNIKQFFKITLPMLMPTLGFVAITSVINSFQVFDQVFVMTRGGPLFKTETTVQYVYSRAFEAYELGYASSIAEALFLIILICSIVMLKSLRKSEESF